VYPALAVLQAAKNEERVTRDMPVDPGNETGQVTRSSSLEILWIGSEGGMEADLISRAGIRFDAIPSAGVHGVGLRSLPGNLLQLVRGFYKARRLLHEYRPDVLFFTGGYVAVPMALAGSNLPSLLYVPDIEPGIALKSIARFADQIAVTTEESSDFFSKPDKTVVTGYPTRSNMLNWKRSEALKVLGLRSDLPILLVMGGSKGARSINRALIPALENLLLEMQVIHISGELDWSEIEKARCLLFDKATDQVIRERYRAFPYLHDEMGAALSIADLVVSRAGASVLGEFPLFRIPAVLVPYPYAWRYQRINAEYLEKHGAAIILKEEDLPEKLLSVVSGLMSDQEQRDNMSQAMRNLSRPKAAKDISQLLQNLAAKQGLKGSEL